MSSELNRLLDQLEGHIDKLKLAYEAYFMGREKLEPIRDRQEISRIVRRLQTTAGRNTAITFRLNGLNQRFMTYQNYWNRILRQIEAGTYHRDLARMQRDLERRGLKIDLSQARSKGQLEAAIMEQISILKGGEGVENPPAESPPAESAGVEGPTPAAAAAEDGMDEGVKKFFRAQAGAPPPLPGDPGRPPPPSPPPPSTPAQGEAPPAANQRLRQLYRAYVAAKSKVGEPTEGITYDRLVRTLQKQVPLIQKKTGCRHVDFKIEIKNGKAILKAVPRN